MIDVEKRLESLGWLLARLKQVPADWLAARPATAAAVGTDNCIECHSYEEVVTSWKKASTWTDGLDCTLSVMLATCTSTPFVGEQLWIKTIGPPSSFKTSLVEALALAEELVLSRDTITGVHSGWKVAGDDEKDCSLAAAAEGKMLAIKDGDTLLKQTNLLKILADLRALYDRVSRTQYMNDIARNYQGHRMTFALCGTKALREIDDSELGARFLDCVVMDAIDDDHEHAVGLRAAWQELRNVRCRSDGEFSSQHPPELAAAMALTGGYARWLAANAERLMRDVAVDEGMVHLINKLGRFVAYMRARPPKKNEEAETTREFSARLVKQLTRLASFLPVVMNRASISDPEVRRRVLKVAMDTARGRTLETVRVLNQENLRGCTAGSLAVHLGWSEDREKTYLRFLSQLGIVRFRIVKTGEYNHQTRWHLTSKIMELWRDVQHASA